MNILKNKWENYNDNTKYIGSLGIMVGGMTAMSPEKRDEIVSLGMKSIFAGVLATCFTAAVVGLII